MQAGFFGKVTPWEGALGSGNQNSDSSWANLGKLLGLSEHQIPQLQTEADGDSNMFHLQFVERIQTLG